MRTASVKCPSRGSSLFDGISIGHILRTVDSKLIVLDSVQRFLLRSTVTLSWRKFRGVSDRRIEIGGDDFFFNWEKDQGCSRGCRDFGFIFCIIGPVYFVIALFRLIQRNSVNGTISAFES